jgi:hypothetical protein
MATRKDRERKRERERNREREREREREKEPQSQYPLQEHVPSDPVPSDLIGYFLELHHLSILPCAGSQALKYMTFGDVLDPP